MAKIFDANLKFDALNKFYNLKKNERKTKLLNRNASFILS